MMKQLLTYLPILTICIIYFGFNNLYGYYHEFGIEINNYISSPDIVLSFLPTILVASGIIYSALFQTVFGEPFETNPTKLENQTSDIEQPKKKTNGIIHKIIKFLNHPLLLYFLVVFIFQLITFFLYKLYDFKDWELQYWTLVSHLLCVGFLIVMVARHQGVNWINENKILVLAILIYSIGSIINQYRKADAKKIKAGISDVNIKFKRKDKTIVTNKNLLYVGQTQAHLFLFDRPGNSTIIYKQSEVDSLVIKNR